MGVFIAEIQQVYSFNNFYDDGQLNFMASGRSVPMAANTAIYRICAATSQQWSEMGKFYVVLTKIYSGYHVTNVRLELADVLSTSVSGDLDLSQTVSYSVARMANGFFWH